MLQEKEAINDSNKKKMETQIPGGMIEQEEG